MKLTELNPQFVGHGGEGITYKGKPVPHQAGVGLAFDCPCGNPDCPRVYIGFENPLEGERLRGDDPRWKRDGDNFETLTLHPSIQRVDDCRWHGWIRGGEVIKA